MQAKTVKSKPMDMEAMQFTGGLESGQQIVEWVESKPGSRAYYTSSYQRNESSGELQLKEQVQIGIGWAVEPGGWVVWDPQAGFSTYDEEKFQTLFEVPA